MNASYYRTARALHQHPAALWDLEYLYEPLPIPEDHPELDLFGFQRASHPHNAPTAVLSTREPHLTKSAANDSLPARQLNEYIYCPRLFYYEHVEGIFLDNADTERGSAIHQKIDRGRGALPKAQNPDAAPNPTPSADNTPTPPESAAPPETETIHSRSAMMSSERLGVVAKMDLIEVQMALIPQSTHNWQPQSTANLTKKTTKKALPNTDQPDLFAAPPTDSTSPDITDTAVPQPQLLHVKLHQHKVQQVTPVDYKVGSPRIGPEANELWDADKMQLGLQILVLRDNGYHCNEGVIYYRATKQRVKLQMTPEVETWIIQNIAEARRTAASPTMPPPLINSPKCVRCSLAPVCLPDETRLLATNARLPENPPSPTRIPLPPRRLIAARDDERALYLNTQGCRVGIKSERLTIKDGDTTLDEIRLSDVTHVSLFGNIQLTTQAIQELCEQEIPIAYFSMGGWFYGLKNVHTRIRQFAIASNPVQCLALARKIVQAKIRNHRTMLMRLHIDPPSTAIRGMKEIAGRVPDARGLDELLGMEGAAAALYFQNLSGMIKIGQNDPDDDIPGLDISTALQKKLRTEKETFTFDFNQRRRRPPTDPVNALLSLAYSLLAKDCTIASLAVGFDPYIGFYHQPRHGRPALALDLMEEFRPLIAESAVLTAINNRMITPGHFVRAGDAVNLTPIGRKAFFQAYEQRMNTLITHPIFDYKVSYRRVLELQARLLARWLTGEIPDYIPMVTR
ncbi:CRISPR-associated endonuclease Cas1 [Prosthecobacter dejongeii]|uniref:CRISPR-associated endonuclease Cas1 n=1 Tax=Prosthecobacter dejongeii TaxID=48465 RepID=A0A7W8DPZ0_9BACT|nr:CRISPR-associated endonuclease Cas1 [Prosthecobacter dejongeii]MBB5038164.1 CRISPR-associated protein Cas1 [Prosthecobacter dejongeii]